MARSRLAVSDPDLLALYLEALKAWNFDGYIEWKARPRDWLRENLGKSFPRACLACGKEAVWPATVDYDAKVRHDGRLYEFRVSALQANQCRECGETTFGNVADEQITRALREHLGLLQPEQIQERLSALGLPPEVFAERIGVVPETVSQWLSGQIVQSRAMDNLMRVFLEFEDVRMALSGSR